MAKGDVLVRMKADVGNYNANLANARRTLQNFKEENLSLGGIMKNMTRSFTGYAAGLMSIGALAGKLHETVTEAVALAKAGEGIRNAFSRLNDPNLLKGLREATHGTVADVELMKAAVKFDDFKLPVSELGTMLAFAQQKAKDTGQSVDYMVDSIVTGLGRKSLMILDNLGLSANEIKEKMKETGDMTKAVGEIIREQMAKSGDYIETAADRAAQSAATMQNKMEELGRKFAPLEEASSSLWTSMKLGILDVVSGPLTRLLNGLTEAGRLRNMLNDMNGEPGSGNTKVDQQLKKLNVIRRAGGSDYYFNTTLSGMLEDYNRQIMELDAKIKGTKNLSPGQQSSKFVRDEVQKTREQMEALAMMRDQLAAGARELTKPVDVKIDTKGAEQNVESLKLKLIELEAQRKNAIMAGNQDLAKDLTKQINQTKSLIKALDPNALKTTKKILPVGSVAALNKKLQELQKQQSMATNTVEWNAYKDKIKEVTEQIKVLKGELGIDALRNVKGVSISDMVSVPTASDIIKRGDRQIKNFKTQDKPTKQEAKLTDVMSQMNSGISSMASGIEGLGIELPKGMKDMLGGIQAVTSILTGISTILTAIEAISAADTIIPFASGGVVKAASGYRVPGRTFSGDLIPALLNAGELVLNQAQAGVIASALQDRDFRGNSGMIQPYVDGERIYLGVNNTVARKGLGEIVTTSMLKKSGINL